jgi:hypothetical protein
LRVSRQERWPLVLIAVGTLACLVDAFMTWAALRGSGSYQEQTPATSSLIGSLGLEGGLAITVLGRVAAFALVAVAVERLPRLSKPLLGLGFLAAAIAWVIVLGNITELAG